MVRSSRGRAPRVPSGPLEVERVQTGVRIEKRILKVLKAIAEYHDLTLGDVIEGIVLHAFDGKPAFGAEGLARIREFRRLYHLTLDAGQSHRLVEAPERPAARGHDGRRSHRSRA